ncbi:MAG: FG-GAP-like repeat-containing protein [Gemmatimonadota bacterium]
MFRFATGSVLAFLFASVPTPLSGQTDTTASVPRAFALLQQSRYPEAVRMLETITARDSNTPRAWSLLGVARLRAGDLPGALNAELKATTFPATRPGALYNTGLIYGAMGQRDSAFAFLLHAKATGRVNMTQIGTDQDAAALKNDSRLAELYPTAAEFAHPFAEPVTILREWDGEAQGDQFGWIARDAGDLDGDGIHDVTTSAPSSGAGGAMSGRVYAYSTASGKLLWMNTGAAGDQLGLGIEAAGDVNRDGIPDIIAGSPGAGKAYVFSGKDGSTLRTMVAEDSADAFGQHVSDLGDVNHDGYADVMVGAPMNGAGGEHAGRAYVYSGKDGSILLTLTGEAPGDNYGTTVAGAVRGNLFWILVGAGSAGPNHSGRTYVYRGLNRTPAFVIESDSTGSSLGSMFISVVGDIDKDGTPDIYASDWSNNANGRSTGRIYVHSGRTGQRLLALTGENAGDGFGIGSAEAGDVNQDGFDDLVIGAWQFAGRAPSGGKIYVYSGKDGTLLRAITGIVPGETLGFDATGLGDVNHDDVPDLLVTSAWSAIRGTQSGRVFVLSGKP